MILPARYEVIRRLGVGAAGSVYLVRDMLRPGLPVALKRLEQASDPAFRASYAREFAVLSSVSLPGVAPVYDLGLMPMGAAVPAGPFFTRAFVDGEPLDSLLVSAPLVDVVGVVLRLAELVSQVHRAGIVHGDLKPANVIVRADGAPWLIDFGLSSRLGSAANLSGSGTPLYMAPELFRGAEPSTSSDVYALGATLFHVLTGQAPFGDPESGGFAAKMGGKLPRWTTDDAQRAGLAEIALRALEPERRERVPSADEFAASLERAMLRAFAVGAIKRQTSAAKAAFVAPRPRGREDLLVELEASTSSLGVHVLYGGRGMGKSTLLRELKWRAQLSGLTAIELSFSGEAQTGADQIRAQMKGVSELDGGDDPVQWLLSLLARTQTSEKRILLVDDLDRADAEFVRVLGALVHELPGDASPVFVTLSGTELLPEAGLAAARVHALVPLSESVLSALVRDSLGNVDASVVAALVAHANGNPGILVEALALVAERPFLTGEEVLALPAGKIGASLLEARFRQLSDQAQRAFSLLVVARSGAKQPLPSALLADVLGSDAWQSVRVELLSAQLIGQEADSVYQQNGLLAEWLRENKPTILQEVAAQAVVFAEAQGVLSPIRAELAWASGQEECAHELVQQAVVELRARGLGRQALELAQRSLSCACGHGRHTLQLSVVELLESLGQLELCIAAADSLVADASAPLEIQTRAQLTLGRAHVASGNLSRAVEVLSSLPKSCAPDCFAQACRELARVHLRRGEPAQAAAFAEQGLEAATLQHRYVRPELLALSATASSMQRGGQGRADARFEEALAEAASFGSERDRAQVLGYRALAFERVGNLAGAEETYALCIEAARGSGDLGLFGTYALNFGNVSFRLGNTDLAVTLFSQASRLARRTGRLASALLAQNNLAHVHLYLGAFSRAQALAESSVSEAVRLGIDIAHAHALQILGEVLSRNGQMEAALSNFDRAAGYYEQLSRQREFTEVLLDSAETLLERAGVSDASAASAKLARARTLLEAHGVVDLRLRFLLLLARARAANGDVQGALTDLDSLATQVEGERDLAWQVPLARAHCQRWLGAEILARKHLLQAAEAIEMEAARVPREARDGFRADPRRRRVLESVTGSSEAPSRHNERSLTRAGVTVNSRYERLLELIKRLARERDVTRLLERITDAAVELSGAERGFVLLTEADGQWVVHTARANREAAHEPSVAFSQSIAEAVLIDGEPIVTVNARDDRRINEFMSVHRLMLKSVACVPIRSLDSVLGVLYLDHRIRVGRFQEEDVELLLAFADHVAVALEHARLWEENARRSRELEQKNQELQAAKTDIERLLEAKTEELELAHGELRRARKELISEVERHGMIGKSPAMRRVFGLIERVADSHVPVVIQGESGTGKELVAKALHATGARSKGPFVAIHCGALPEQLIESELFGHVRGAFTGAERDKKGAFQQADGGTLFLDEFADVPPRMQLDLLRVLQEGRVRPVGADTEVAVDVRVVVATNSPLQELVQARRLREDLFYRLNVVEIRLPALRERMEDLPVLCEHLLARAAHAQGTRPKRLSRHAYARIAESAFPGNIRQLEHLLLSAAMMAEGTLIQVTDLPADLRRSSGTSRHWDAAALDHEQAARAELGSPADAHAELGAHAELDARVELGSLAERASTEAQGGQDMPSEMSSPTDLRSFKDRERQRILDALALHGWNRVKAATALGMPRRTLYRRLAEFGIL